jgi:hypothetical protein
MLIRLQYNEILLNTTINAQNIHVSAVIQLRGLKESKQRFIFPLTYPEDKRIMCSLLLVSKPKMVMLV